MSDSVAQDLTQKLILDASKIQWHIERVQAWERGEKIAPITIDMSLNQKCNYKCGFCYMQLQKQERYEPITTEIMMDFLDDCAEMGVKGISLVSDGESTLSKAFIPTLKRGHELGISMASGTNAWALTGDKLGHVMPYLTYLRVNFSAGQRDRYAEIMGCKPTDYDRVVSNIEDMVEFKKRYKLPVTLGIQMVLMPQDADQIMPFAELGVKLGVDYAVIKHCSDDEFGTLGVDYSRYECLYSLLHDAEALSTATCQVTAKWNKIKAGNVRSYQRCYGPPFIIQISGSGLVAPCGMLFNDRYKEKFHIGNIATERFRDIIKSDRYWEVVKRLASDEFDAQTMCGSLCLQHLTNIALDEHVKGNKIMSTPTGQMPQHVNFI